MCAGEGGGRGGEKVDRRGQTEALWNIIPEFSCGLRRTVEFQAEKSAYREECTHRACGLSPSSYSPTNARSGGKTNTATVTGPASTFATEI